MWLNQPGGNYRPLVGRCDEEENRLVFSRKHVHLAAMILTAFIVGLLSLVPFLGAAMQRWLEEKGLLNTSVIEQFLLELISPPNIKKLEFQISQFFIQISQPQAFKKGITSNPSDFYDWTPIKGVA
ncbi:MAG: hypothetical protein EPO20_15535 [Betaproteobacteria bacterium]|nr:MAG: hypothetical protein EPO20_15535 [Betaproteobacteria bacterium]